MPTSINFSYSFDGADASDGRVDLYDAAEALVGFHRSLAITLHLVAHGEVITQAPSLRDLRILATTPEDGSWKVIVTVVGALHALGSAEQSSVLGHLTTSAYSYIVSESLGFEVDFNKTLGQQYKELKSKESPFPILDQTRFDSAIEKCEASIKNMHRPIIWSQTAETGKIEAFVGGVPIARYPKFDLETYEYLQYTKRSERPYVMSGRVSSYNMNTYKGRIYVPEEGRPIPFRLDPHARTEVAIADITNSLASNAQDPGSDEALIHFRAFKNTSRTDRLKSLEIVDVRDSDNDFDEE